LLLLQQPLLPLPPLAVLTPLPLLKRKRKKKRKAASTVLARSLVEQGPIAADSHAG
jgi:hypothetical protein